MTKRWCIPPEQNGDFVWRMEDILNVYTRPYDPKRPLVCLDEASKQLLADARPGTPPEPGRAQWIDCEYERRGTANLFLWCEPLGGRRHVRVTERRTRVDWAHTVRDLVDVHYPDADKIVLVMDNLNTHSPGSLCEAFPPAEAKRLADKLEIHYTPKHGSWLNIAELELSVLARQCLDAASPTERPWSARSRLGRWSGARRQGRLAVHDAGRPHQAEAVVPVNPWLTGH